MTEEEVADWLYEEVSAEGVVDLDMGELEKKVGRKIMDVCRATLEKLTQDRAASEEFGCPKCGRMLRVVAHGRHRTVDSTYGKIGFARSYGKCLACCEYVYPADVALGLHNRARTSPRIQEICAVAALNAPAGKAEEDVRRMAGIDICSTKIHNEACRQGQRAIEIRDRDVELSESPYGKRALAERAPVLPKDSTLVIEIDAWNIRERDHWGQTEEMRKAGQDVGRWHWVYTGTIFRLDQRITTQTNRRVIADRKYVATRQGVDSFKQQLYAEALQCGLLQAETVLVLADGAVWIWNLADDRRFRRATQRVDLYHVKEHLWGLANQLFAKGTDEAKEWIHPYLDWLEKHDDGALRVIAGLEELKEELLQTQEKKAAAVETEIGYFNRHKGRMDYTKAEELGQPRGSGAIESTCSQYQVRFKRTGQFWSLEGDEALLALETLRRNNRWHLLFPHDKI